MKRSVKHRLNVWGFAAFVVLCLFTLLWAGLQAGDNGKMPYSVNDNKGKK